MSYCRYFQAYVDRKQTWFFVATLRSYEHVLFDRTFDKQTGKFEFFVAPGWVNIFYSYMRWYEKQGIVTGLKELPNRLQEEEL